MAAPTPPRPHPGGVADARKTPSLSSRRRLASPRPERRGHPPAITGHALVPPLALVGAIVLGGQPIWSSQAGASLAAPPHWQRSQESVGVASQLVDVLEPGDVVLAPPDLGITITVMTTRIKTVAPRKYFMDYLEDEPGFHYKGRGLLMDFVDPPPGTTPAPARRVGRALDAVDVTAVCVLGQYQSKLDLLTGIGFRSSIRSAGYACVRR